ncbi:related to transcription initiation factor TFIID [Ramularia collo-cygni]|uniref:Related to transcription initiation factor TFIID n=1 Tax=Ramularia collo-cygni TaxID=112498 RepID=A0A2D3UW99_9PEZI|nr:related to transcription initiation factor TFIID [Ramularia collo-cygni]CZT17360.1 related to transcription initiation factor TFIID [Ramularia collo-cygni]
MSSPTARSHSVIGDVPYHPKISNIVAGVDLCCLIDLKLIALHVRNSTYNPKRFPAVVLRIKEPKATALVFHRGKMQILGTKSVADAHLAGRKFARILEKQGFNTKFENFNVQNVVASVDTKMAIRLEGIAAHPAHYQFARYEPELFPGLCYRVESPKVTFLVFSTGKVVAVGARSVEHIHEAWQKMYPILVGFRIDA